MSEVNEPEATPTATPAPTPASAPTPSPTPTPSPSPAPVSVAPTAEIRDGIPMVTRLKYTIMPASRFDPIRDLGNGQYEGVMNQDTPGMVFGVTPFVCNKPHKDLFFEFKEKAFWESQLSQLQADQAARGDKPDNTIAMAIDRVSLMLSSHKLWLEELFTEAGVTNLAGSWAKAFSDSLDEFPVYKEPAQRIGGLPYILKQIRWDARLPYQQPKQIEVTIGIYGEEDLSDVPTEDKLVFEDGMSLRNRQAQQAQLAARVVEMTKMISDMKHIQSLLAQPQTEEILNSLSAYNPDLVKHPDLPALIKNQEDALENVKREQASIAAIRFGVLANLVGHVSVATTIKSLCLAAYKLKSKYDPKWANLNHTLMAQLFALPDVT